MSKWLYILVMFGATLAWTTAAQDTNLPPVEIILDEVLERSQSEHENDRQFKNHYTYLRSRTTRELDSKGQVKKEQTKQSRNTPAIVPTSYNPSASTAGSIAHTNKQASSSAQNRAFDKNDFILNRELLSRFEFELVKLDEVNGRPAYLINFQPSSKKLPARNLKERFMNKAAGSIWIDETDLVLSKTDLHLMETINVVGGLVGAVKKFNYTLVRTRTPDGLWYANDIHWRLEGREILSRKVLQYEESRSEVKKVH